MADEKVTTSLGDKLLEAFKQASAEPEKFSKAEVERLKKIKPSPFVKKAPKK